MKNMDPKPATPKLTVIEMDPVRLGEAIKSDFGIVLTAVEKTAKGYQSEVYRAKTTEGRMVFIRINKKGVAFEVESLGYKMLREESIPVPQVISYQENPPTIGHPTMIIEAAEGVSLEETNLSETEKEKIYQSWGEILRRINEIKLEGFGTLEVVDGKLRGKYKSYEEYCHSQENNYNEVVNTLVKNNLITPEEAEKLHRIIKEINSLNFGQASLLHRDLKKEHIFINHGKITGIIDLGRLQAGDPRNDIAKSLLYQNNKEKDFFKKGYGKLADDPIVIKYLAVRATTVALPRTKEGHKEVAEKALEILKKILSEF